MRINCNDLLRISTCATQSIISISTLPVSPKFSAELLILKLKTLLKLPQPCPFCGKSARFAMACTTFCSPFVSVQAHKVPLLRPRTLTKQLSVVRRSPAHCRTAAAPRTTAGLERSPQSRSPITVGPANHASKISLNRLFLQDRPGVAGACCVLSNMLA